MLVATRPFIVAALVGTIGSALFAAETTLLRNSLWLLTIQPETLHVVGKAADGGELLISAAGPRPLDVAHLQQGDDTSIAWQIPSAKIDVAMTLDGNALEVRFTSPQPGDFAWPDLQSTADIIGYMLPMFEGLYIPAASPFHVASLVEQGPMNTTADLSMPFVGVDYGRHSLTYIFTNPFNNELTFRSENSRLAARFAHRVTRNHKVGEWGVRVVLGAASPVEPARQYRQWLIDTKQFVDMNAKIARTPDAAKLAGAAHIYLWGSGLITRHDVTDWKGFARKLRERVEAEDNSFSAFIWHAMKPEVRDVLTKLPLAEWVDDYTKAQIADELSVLLESVKLPVSIPGKMATNPRQCCEALFRDFSNALKPVDTWGDGVSIKMLRSFADNGFDRLWLGVDGYKALRAHPEVAEEAKRLGYLIGPYDSYHSIHSPTDADTWESAQFDAELYETGAIVTADGKKRKGFKQKGYTLSPIAARPYVEKRVSSLAKEVSPNSLFIDCDAFGDVFDDYSDAHPATQQQDMQARLDRMAWIRDTFHLVIGSEGGSAYAASTIHFAHGMMTPGIGWGDRDLTDRKSPYDLGAYFPPDGPAVFFKSTAIKDKYRDLYFDPRYRLPLYETAFHDCLVTTHQWGFGSLKFKDLIQTRAMLELLYGVPPLYHMNIREFAARKDQLKAHYAVFSPLHREVATLPMTTFEWLTPDHLVQRTVFGDRVEITANFSDKPVSRPESTIPAHSVSIKRGDAAKPVVYSPH